MFEPQIIEADDLKICIIQKEIYSGINPVLHACALLLSHNLQYVFIPLTLFCDSLLFSKFITVLLDWEYFSVSFISRVFSFALRLLRIIEECTYCVSRELQNLKNNLHERGGGLWNNSKLFYFEHSHY